MVLGDNLERQLFRALELNENWLTFLTRPLSALFLALAVASILFSLYQDRKIERLKKAAQREDI